MTAKWTIFAGPCSIESLETCREIAKELCVIQENYSDIQFIFKASYDKANRTSIKSYRGLGMLEGLRVLSRIREEYSLPTITDVHESAEVKEVSKYVDYLQIPAFLCRQTDLLLSAARTGLPVMVKKGQFLAPQNVGGIIAKLQYGGCRDILICERGTTFGYNDLVVDFRGLVTMRNRGARVIYDATHSVQRPGQLGDSSGGEREFIEPLARAAASVGVDGLFFEVHPDPNKALSDGPNTLKLKEFSKIITEVKRYRHFAS